MFHLNTLNWDVSHEESKFLIFYDLNQYVYIINDKLDRFTKEKHVILNRSVLF